MKRCAWSLGSDALRDYHDFEWGKESHDNRYIFEMLCLEGMQAGLSWRTILEKRQNYKDLFHNFEIDKVALMTEADIDQLLQNPGIIRHRLKISAIINNAKIAATMDLNDFFWSYVETQIVNYYDDEATIPATNDLSTRISKDLKKLGFKFIGPTIIYSFMQAIGMINDHIDACDFK